MASFDRLSLDEALRLLCDTFSETELERLLAQPAALAAELKALTLPRDARIESWFPNLVAGEYRITSEIDYRYNCIAWAVGSTDRFWWPVRHYWPEDLSAEETIAAFASLLRRSGYEPCSDADVEAGFEKVALFARDGIPTHAAKQLPHGGWTSKLGRWEDIEHELSMLTGSEYGEVVQVFRRAIS